MSYRMSQGVGKLEQHAVCDGTPIWRMKSDVMTICKFFHVSENALYQAVQTRNHPIYCNACEDFVDCKNGMNMKELPFQITTILL